MWMFIIDLQINSIYVLSDLKLELRIEQRTRIGSHSRRDPEVKSLGINNIKHKNKAQKSLLRKLCSEMIRKMCQALADHWPYTKVQFSAPKRL